MRSQSFRTMKGRILVFWVTMSCNFVDDNQSFGESAYKTKGVITQKIIIQL